MSANAAIAVGNLILGVDAWFELAPRLSGKNPDNCGRRPRSQLGAAHAEPDHGAADLRSPMWVLRGS
jgi:hypothetical protein